MKYFNNITTKEELKKQFRNYCVTMHPDKGGNADEFKAIVAEYETACKDLGAWNKKTAEEVAGIKRGTLVIYDGPSCVTLKLIVLTVNADTIECLRIVDECKSLDDVSYYCEDDFCGTNTRQTFERRDIAPLSRACGIGYYWDDIDGKTYTEQEIAQYEHNAKTFETWCKNYEEAEAEKERIAKEEEDRREAAIIAEWSQYLEEIPAAHKYLNWDEIKDLPRAERQAREKADKKEGRRKDAQRIAAFKRNIKAVFNRYFPGVKITVTNSSKAWCESSVLSWVDGPTEAEVEAVEAFDYFRASYFECAGPYEDYGHTCSRSVLSKFRKLFGAWSDDRIEYKRTLSDEATAEVRKVIAENFPAFEENRKKCEAEHGEKGCCWYDELTLTDEKTLRHLMGFNYSVPDWSTSTEEERKVFYKAEEPYNDRVRYYRKGNSGLTLNYSTLFKLLTEYYKSETTEPKKESTSRKQSGKTATTDNQSRKESAAQDAAAAHDTTDTTNEAPAEGLELIETAEGVAVVGDQRTTYRNRKAIKAHGARWNKDAQQWQATDPEAVARLRQRFGVADDPTTDEQAAEEAAASNEQPAAEQPAAADEQPAARATPLHDAEEITETDRANLSALSGLAFALQSITSSLLSAFDDWKADDVAARILRKNIADSLEEIKKLNERLRDYSDRLDAIEKRQAAREEATEAADDLTASSKQAETVEQPQATTEESQAAPEEPQADQQANTRKPAGDGSDKLEMLKAAAEDAERLTKAGEYTAATLAKLYALTACGVDVRDIIDRVRSAKEQAKAGGLTGPAAWSEELSARREAMKRAAQQLTPEAFRTLYHIERAEYLRNVA